MTYSRHYGRLEGVVARVGPDLARVVSYFRAIDSAKPAPEELLQRLSIRDRKSLEFVRAYEEAVIRTIDQAGRGRAAGLR